MKKKLALIACMLVGCSSGAIAQTTAGEPSTQVLDTSAGQSTAGGSLEDIVVTATRRSERLQDVPVAVTALTSETMQAAGLSDIRNLTQVVPGFFGGKNLGLFLPVIRGVGSSSSSAGDEANVATYIDGIYQPDPFSTYIDLAQVERVEVLRGPQGTVFGRNATGGLINVITPEPEFETSGNISAKYGRLRNSTSDVDIRGYITGGLTDKLAADFSGIYRDTGDYIKNLLPGKDVGGIRVIDLRSKLLFQPSDSSQIILTGEFVDQKSSTNATQPFGTNTAGRSFPGYVAPTGPWQIAVNTRPILDFKRYNVALRTKFELGAVNLETSTGYMHNRTVQITDSDASNIPLGQVDANLPGVTSESISQEIRLLSAGNGPFKWILGAYGFHLHADAGIRIFSNPTGGATSGTSTFLSPNIWTTSYAGFGEGTYEVADRLFFTAGVRYTWEKREFSQNVNGVDLAFGKAHKSFGKVTYRGALRYNFSDNANIYASYGTGYKSGVYNYVSTAPVPVEPETIKSYEIGFKADPLHWLRTNLSTYYYDYRNLQVQAKSPTGNTFVLQNAATAKIYGGELELTAAATPDLNIRGSVAYTHGDYKSFPLAQTFVPQPNGGNLGVTADVSGNQMTRSPRTSFNVGFDWGHDIGDGRISVSSNVFHSAKVYFDFANRFAQKNYTLVSGEIGYTIMDNALRFSLWATNLTNAKVFREIRIGASSTDVTYEQPRRVGVGASYKF
ncbi:TonB-dependent receptor [uncultured Sphingobium sp.]|uniref:TonB-dependent receptor n=1 Tax=uncultured Sphingobium sp. TaxID=316087 RepID=UPI00259AEB9E|nr:TonB-dependent receptor [uncultured Sphingobium sp.]